MKTIQLGTPGLTVSNLCMGTVGFGSTVDTSTSFAYMDRFAELDAGAVNAYANEYMSQYYWADFLFNDF